MTNQENQFGDVGSLLSGPVGQMGISSARSYASAQLDKYRGISSQIFTQQIRQFFDVNTSFVGRKILKLLMPFKTFQWDDQVKKVQLYIPIISFATLILFSTIVQGITSDNFDPKMGRKILWIVLISTAQIIMAKCSETTISNLNIGFLYRFVPLALLTILLTVTNMSVPYLNVIGVIYLLISDTYFCKLLLQTYERQVFRQGGLGSKIALLIHFFTTLIISWICDLI